MPSKSYYKHMVFLVAFFALANVIPAQADTVIKVKSAQTTVPYTEYETFVLSALMQDIGIALSNEKKEGAVPDSKEADTLPLPPPAPSPNPEPEPEPEPEPKKDPWGFNKMRNDFQQEYSDTLSQWSENYQKVLADWAKSRQQYQLDEDKYLAATVDLSQLTSNSNDLSPLAKNADTQPLQKIASGDFHIIPYSLTIPIKNQLFRGTCAAFAGTRAVETVLHQNDGLRKYQIDLSEQHFYWLSKPNCMKFPCIAGKDQEGSNFDSGFIFSKKGNSAVSAFRQEQYCPYKPTVNKRNLTYTPLQNCTSAGQFKVNDFTQGLRISDVISELQRNKPIAAGFKLTQSFFKTTGLVKARDALNAKDANGKHAGGHAVLLVGYIKLPEKYWEDEGKYCAITANSWGTGYGKGGYACLSETWMQENTILLNKHSGRSVLSSLGSVIIL